MLLTWVQHRYISFYTLKAWLDAGNPIFRSSPAVEARTAFTPAQPTSEAAAETLVSRTLRLEDTVRTLKGAFVTSEEEASGRLQLLEVRRRFVLQCATELPPIPMRTCLSASCTRSRPRRAMRKKR